MDTKLKHETVVILGAHPDSSRYAYKAAEMLHQAGHTIIPIGRREGLAANTPILTSIPDLEPGSVDTITLYINPRLQENYIDFVSELHPKRVIFNPGTENMEWAKQLQSEGVEVDFACTLVLLATHQY